MTDSSAAAQVRADGPEIAALTRWARRGVWALPLYALLLAVSTVTHQPDYTTDFAAYADYVTTDRFLISHLVASILGAALGVLGAVALGVLIARRNAARLAMAGVVCTVFGNVLFTAIFAAAAFAQPAVGQAWLEGAHDAAESVNSDVYGPSLFATFAVGAPLFVAGAVLLGIAIRRYDHGLRRLGSSYAVLLPLFVISGFTFAALQPVMGAALAIATSVLAHRLQGSRGVTP